MKLWKLISEQNKVNTVYEQRIKYKQLIAGKNKNIQKSKYQNNTQQYGGISVQKSRTWSSQEDDKLKKYVKMYGQRWSVIARVIQTKKGKQCRQRWKNHLDPKLNQNEWTLLQQWNLYLGCQILDTQWSKMSQIFVNRTDNNLKNHCKVRKMKQKQDFFSQKLSQIIINHNLLDIVQQVESRKLK